MSGSSKSITSLDAVQWFENLYVVSVEDFDVNMPHVDDVQLTLAVVQKRIFGLVVDAERQKSATEFVGFRIPACDDQGHTVPLAAHAVEVGEVDVAACEQLVGGNLESDWSKRGVQWRLAVFVSCHEEQTVQSSVDRRSLIPTVVLDVGLHQTVLVAEDVSEILFGPVTV